MSKAAESRLKKAVSELNSDLDMLAKVLGYRCPLYDMITTRDRDFLKVKVVVDGKLATIHYTWEKEGFGTNAHYLIDEVRRFTFERFCETLYGDVVKNTACRSAHQGISIDADFSK
jgi:hypothetical protein